MSRPLAGKVALVTGAGRGIGRAIAIGFAEAGAAVCCSARTASDIEATAATIRAQSGAAMAHAVPERGDGCPGTIVGTDEIDVDRGAPAVRATVSKLGRLDIVVINAGISTGRGAVADSDPDGWRATIDVNLIGAYYCARAAVPALRHGGGGKIILIGSGIGHRGTAGNSAYACSKAALWMFTRVLAQEVVGDNISVNELIPGPVDTSLLPPDPAGRAFMGQTEWLKRPEDVMPLALFLATQPAIGPTAQSFSLMRRDK
jgi:3-oxoacyl-[acyl-carrier protein] reductase